MKGWSGANKEEGGGKEGSYQKRVKHWRRFRLKREGRQQRGRERRRWEEEEEDGDLFQGKVESERGRGKVEGWAAGILQPRILLQSHGQVSFFILEWGGGEGGGKSGAGGLDG